MKQILLMIAVVALVGCGNRAVTKGEFIVRIQGNGEKITDKQRKRIIETLDRRLQHVGTKGQVKLLADGNISIKYSGLASEQLLGMRLLKVLTKTSKLEFRLEHAHSRAAIRSNEDFLPGADLLSYTLKGEDNQEYTRSLFVVTMEDYPEKCVSGKHIVSASPIRDPISGMAKISFKLDAVGADKMAKITHAHQVSSDDPRALCIVLDGKLISAPSINSRIHSRAEISGDFTFDEARELANVLENPLNFPLQIIEER
jgi:preprotein translocase subunit SecD